MEMFYCSIVGQKQTIFYSALSMAPILLPPTDNPKKPRGGYSMNQKTRIASTLMILTFLAIPWAVRAADVQDILKGAKLSGEYFVYANTQHGTLFKSEGPGHHFDWFEQYARIKAVADVDNNTKVELGLLYGRTDGDDIYGKPAGREDITFDVANVTFSNVLNTPLKVSLGKQNMVIGDGFILGFSEAIDAAIWSIPLRAFPLGARAIYEYAIDNTNKFTFDAYTMKDNDTYFTNAGIPRADGHGYIYGGDIKYEHGDSFYAGFTAFEFARAGGFDSIPVVSLRASYSPQAALKGFNIRGEYAAQLDRGSSFRDAVGAYGQASYTFNTAWTPKITLHAAKFSGDDPNTPEDESFFPVMINSFNDYGQWVYGEIVGEYVLLNTNKVVYFASIGVNPTSKAFVRVFYIKNDLDKIVAPATSKSFATEWNVEFDYTFNDHLTFGSMYAYASPDTAAKEMFGDANWRLFEAFLKVSF